MVIFSLEGKKALVTGGTRGLGHSMAEGLMEAGAEVVIFGTTERVFQVAEAFVSRGLPCHGLIVDLSSRPDREKGFHAALDLLGGKIDILVNAAGVQRRHPAEDFPMEDWDLVLEVNLTAPFHLCQLAGREMIKQQSGKIINMSSMNGFFGGSTIPAYAASKGGINQLTKTLCNDWASKGINVNAIAPGYMETEMNAALMEPANPRNAEITKRIPTHRWGTPNDMKGLCVFLASDASNYLNGAIIPVDGGYLAKS